MSTSAAWTLAMLPRGSGRALDLGDGRGSLREGVRARGHGHTNLDLARRDGAPSVLGDAHLLRSLLRDFDVIRFETGLWAFTTVGYVLSEGRRIGLGALERWVRAACARLDRLAIRRESASASASVVVARKRSAMGE